MAKSGFTQSVERIKAERDYDPQDAGYKRLIKRIEVEGKIARKTAQALLAAGYTVGVNDGEDTTVTQSSSITEIMAAMFSTDEDYMLVYTATAAGGESNGVVDGEGPRADRAHMGWIRLIYGNSGYDVISDYTVNLEDVVAPVNAYADTLEEKAA
jgi:hypothetical protein